MSGSAPAHNATVALTLVGLALLAAIGHRSRDGARLSVGSIPLENQVDAGSSAGGQGSV